MRRPRVLIAGGGVAGIEAALALRDLAGERVEVDMRTPQEEFVYRPFAVGEPYGAARIFRYSLQRVASRCGISLHADSVVSVTGDRRLAVTRDGEKIAYDYLIVAPGTRMLWAVPGAVTFWGVADEGGVGDVVSELRSGRLHRVLFTMPSGCSWALPVYELALFAATTLARSSFTGTRLTVVTPEDAPLELFGRRASELMGGILAEHGIEVVTGTHPVKFEAGRLLVAPGEAIEADAAITLPRLEGRCIDGIPHDEGGFVPVDEHLRVHGMDRIYAVGDVTAFPVKQGGIATQQADAAAEAIAAEVGAGVEPKAFDPILRGVLWTGTEPWYLYGKLTGGHGETSTLTATPPWSPHDGKIIGRYLTPFLESVERAAA
jgi:sulfide:quinone oxidoreductase